MVSLRSNRTLSQKVVPGQPGLYRETLSLKKKKKEVSTEERGIAMTGLSILLVGRM